MNRTIDITEIVGSFGRQERMFEVCATAEARYDDIHSVLELKLDSFVRLIDMTKKERHLREPWLPPAETLREGVAWEESSQLAKEIFQRWVAKVRQRLTSLENPQLEENHACQIQH